MATNIDLKNIWQQQKSEQPDMTEMLEELKRYKKANLRKIAKSNIMLGLTSAFIILIWVYFQPQYISTKIGIVIIILAMVIYLLFYNRISRSLRAVDNTESNRDYVRNLKALAVKQKFMQTTMLSIYFIMLSVGICLYMFEYAIRMTLLWGVFTYLITLSWIAFNWFYFRPRVIKKQQLKIDELITTFKHINSQWPEEQKQ